MSNAQGGFQVMFALVVGGHGGPTTAIIIVFVHPERLEIISPDSYECVWHVACVANVLLRMSLSCIGFG